MVTWPVTIDGILTPAHGDPNQYEFQCRSYKAINSALPLASGNPYTVTVSSIPGKRNKGIPIECKFNNYDPVECQFHRRQRIWIGSNRTLGGWAATDYWRRFMIHFGIVVGVTKKTIPVYLDFYPNLSVVIRLSTGSVPKSS